MKRILLLVAAASAVAMATPVVAQEASVRPGVTTNQRPAIDADAIARNLRDRGVPESDIAASMERIRYWLSLGASPARIRAFLNQQNGDAPVRPDGTRPVDVDRPEVADAVRPVDVVRPVATETPVPRARPIATRPSLAVRPVDVQRPDSAVRPEVTPPVARGLRPARPPVGN